MATLDSKLVGVLGDRTTKVLKDLFGYHTVGDLLHHYPRRYLVRGELSDISELNEGDEVTFNPSSSFNIVSLPFSSNCR